LTFDFVGFRFVLKENISHSETESSEEDQDVPLQMNMSWSSILTPVGGGGSRAGLFRTPISGGVQSATSAHGLPRPALAVRNLMEQVSCLCCFW